MKGVISHVFYFGVLVGLCYFADLGMGLWAQPVVPKNLDFAGMHLRLSSHARKEIQEKVDRLFYGQISLQTKALRAEIYFPIIERIFKEEDVPLDFKYLSIQESALIGDAVSSSQAIGFWQFKIPAAKEVGLRIDRSMDERKHIIASTRGAARYLKRNNFFYHNWIYALTSYNTGRGGAEDYVQEKYLGKKNMTISKKTHWYVKTFLAHLITFEEVLKDRNSKKDLYLLEYGQGSGKTLADIAKKFNVEVEELKRHNLWLKAKRVPEGEYIVMVPSKEFKKLPGAKRSRSSPRVKKSPPLVMVMDVKKKFSKEYLYALRIHGIRAILSVKGEQLPDLIARSGLDDRHFLKYNDIIDERHRVKVGYPYYLRPKRGKASVYYHLVLKNDTWWSISQLYGIRMKSLVQKNRMSLGDSLRVGTVLWLRKKRPTFLSPDLYQQVIEPILVEKLTQNDSIPEIPEPKIPTDSIPKSQGDSTSTALLPYPHWIEKGQTLYGIARAYHVSVIDIMQWNGMEDPNFLAIGAKLNLYIPPPDTMVVVPVQEHRLPYDSLLKELRKKELKLDSLWSFPPFSVPDSIPLSKPPKIPADTTQTPQRERIPILKEDSLSAPLPKELPSDPITHVVQPEETIYGIARRYGVAVEEIMQLNKKGDNYQIQVGEQLIIKE
ncbi:MAG: LysM peptidoglycan-binding domain-containing protein [Cytophagales bacterium]|nr:LysM peptidoglycan-binding domain-containing protein [Cytophagales bacterium]